MSAIDVRACRKIRIARIAGSNDQQDNKGQPPDMNIDQLSKWLSLAANLGVIAGIIFLALEINQSNRVAIAANDIALRQSFATLNESVLSNRELVELLYKARDPKSEFSDIEQEILLTYVARQFNTWGSYERAYLAGLTSEDAMDGTVDDVRRMVQGFPGLWKAYKLQVEAYPGYSESIIYRTVRELVEKDSEGINR